MSQIYITCPTCSHVLAMNYTEFMLERDQIVTDEKMSPDVKRDKFSALLDKYNYQNICCRMRIMGFNYNPIPNLAVRERKR